jgi:hypothetical protein
MTDQFKIAFNWLPRDYGDAIERATLADLAILVCGKSATRLEDKIAKTIRDSSRLSAFHLAKWFAANWWRLRWEPESQSQDWRMSHQISGAGGAYSWPNVTLSTDGTTMAVRARPTDSVTDPVRYLANFDERVSATEFETTIDEFVGQVLMRLREFGVNESALNELWREVLDERADAATAEYRKLEALLSYDPGEAPEDLILKLQANNQLIGLQAVEEIAAAYKWEAVDNITKLTGEGESASTPIMVPDAEKLKRRIKIEVSESLLPWDRAARAAQIVRQTWDITPGPVSTERLANLLNFDPSLIQSNPGSKLPMEAAFRADANSDRVAVLLRHSWPTRRRFALARLIADHVTAEASDHLLPATDAKTARQKFQRAFARNFLCPAADLKAALNYAEHPTDDAIEEAAEGFDVSEMVVRNILVDEGMLDRDGRWD